MIGNLFFSESRKCPNNNLYKGIQSISISFHFCMMAIIVLFSSPAAFAKDNYELSDLYIFFQNQNLPKLEQAVHFIRNRDVHEAPNYAWLVYQAYLDARSGNVIAAREDVLAFQDMLRVDSGVLRCSATEGDLVLNGSVRHSPHAYSMMCGEIFYSYYENPSDQTMDRISMLWSVSALVLEYIDDEF